MGSIIIESINIACDIPGPIGFELKKGSQPKLKFRKFRNGRKNGSITNIAHRPNTTDGIAANNSIIIPNKFLILLGIISSVIKIAVPTPKGI